jgi:hypothetical protein
LKEKYPNSFSHKTYQDSEDYREYTGRNYTYYHNPDSPQFRLSTDVKESDIKEYADLLQNRPQKTLLPQFMLDLGLTKFEFLLDFGSFRDLQRHRNGVCRMPLITTEFDFNEWYLDQLPDDLRIKANELIANQTKALEELDCSPEDKQYYIAMGYNVSCSLSFGLPAMVYVIELRAGRTVHPSLRKVIHEMSRAVEAKFPDIKLYTDYLLDDWDVRRGSQDIIENPTR